MSAATEVEFVPEITRLLNNLFQIDDRRDGIADILVMGDFDTASVELNEAIAAWDTHLGREHIAIPVGMKFTRFRVGSVMADDEATRDIEDDDGNWVKCVSAFPGLVRISELPQVRVNSLNELEVFRAANVEHIRSIPR